MIPETRYARSDDVLIAYRVTGHAPGTVSHLDMDREFPLRTDFYRHLTKAMATLDAGGANRRGGGIASLRATEPEWRCSGPASGSVTDEQASLAEQDRTHRILLLRHPRGAIEVAGYTAIGSASIVGRAIEAGSLHIPGWIFNSLLRELRDGYAVWTFDPVA